MSKYKNTAEHVMIKLERPNHQIGCKMYQNSKSKNAKSVRNVKIKKRVSHHLVESKENFETAKSFCILLS